MPSTTQSLETRALTPKDAIGKNKPGLAWLKLAKPALEFWYRSGCVYAKSFRRARDPKTNIPVPSRRKLDGSGVTSMSKFAEATTSDALPSAPPRISKVPA
jgi:hypothetical protein